MRDYWCLNKFDFYIKTSHIYFLNLNLKSNNSSVKHASENTKPYTKTSKIPFNCINFRLDGPDFDCPFVDLAMYCENQWLTKPDAVNRLMISSNSVAR